MPAIEVIGGGVVGSAGVQTAAVIFPGNSNVIRSFKDGAFCQLIAFWGYTAGQAFIQMNSPRMHDNVQGIRLNLETDSPLNQIPPYLAQSMFEQDQLNLSIFANDVAPAATNLFAMFYYSDLPGANANLASPSEIAPRIKNVFPIQLNAAAGAANTWGNQVMINGLVDLFKANTEYALLGVTADDGIGAIRIMGIDTGNLGVAVPICPRRLDSSATWFWKLSEKTGLPCIPILNSSNKDAISIDFSPEGGAALSMCNIILAELG